MKKIVLLITLLTFTNVSFSQSELSFDAGLTTEYGANLLAINYNLSLSENMSWHATIGLPTYSSGFTYQINKNRFTLVVNDMYSRDWRLRIAYSKEKSI